MVWADAKATPANNAAVLSNSLFLIEWSFFHDCPVRAHACLQRKRSQSCAVPIRTRVTFRHRDLFHLFFFRNSQLQARLCSAKIFLRGSYARVRRSRTRGVQVAPIDIHAGVEIERAIAPLPASRTAGRPFCRIAKALHWSVGHDAPPPRVRRGKSRPDRIGMLTVMPVFSVRSVATPSRTCWRPPLCGLKSDILKRHAPSGGDGRWVPRGRSGPAQAAAMK
jgi:hypothetical protein